MSTIYFVCSYIITPALFTIFMLCLFFDQDDECEMTHDLIQTEKYENKYVDYIDNINDRKLTTDELVSLQHSVLLENTPMGTIVMYYHHESESFCFFCDRKDVPYKYLDTVARKYVKIFDCKMIYTSIGDELEQSKINLEKKHEVQKKESSNTSENKSQSDVFASYKKYNLKSDKKVNDQDYLIKENINSFKFTGFLKDYKFLHPSKSEEKKEDKSVLSYEDFINTVEFIQNPN